MRTLLCAAFALSLSTAGIAAEPKRVLLIGQKPDGHPVQTHEYMAGQRLIAKLLASVPGVEVAIDSADEPWARGPEALDRCDAAVIFVSQGAKWFSADPKRLEAFKRLAARGGGVTALHWGMGTKDAADIEAFVSVVGGCHGGPDRKYVVTETVLKPAADPHPIAAGVGALKVKEEFYYRLKLAKTGLTPVLTARIEDKDETVCWALERADGGRGFGFSGLHFHDNWKHESYRRVVLQGILWTLKKPIPAAGVPAADLKTE